MSTTLNLDKRQINETKFDPNSKVERSIYNVKSVDSSKDAASAPTVSVDQNIPQEVKPATSTDASSKKKEDKQETVNYEIDSRQIATTSAGYVIERMSVAVVINKKAILNSLPAGGNEKDLTARIAEIEAVVRSASGVLDTRGDSIKVSAIDFFVGEVSTATGPELGFGDYFKGNLGTIINAISLIVAMLVVLLFGLRPALKVLVSDQKFDDQLDRLEVNVNSALAAPPPGNMNKGLPNLDFDKPSAEGDSPKEQLNRLVNVDVDRAAQVLKKWLNDKEQAAA